MNEEILNNVLNEFAGEQKENRISIHLLQTGIEKLNETVSKFDEKLSNIKITIPSLDMQPIDDGLNAHFKKVESIVAAQPKEVKNEKRIYLFSVDGYKLEFYKKMFGQLLKWTVILIIALYIISVLKPVYNNYQNEKYKAAWEIIYKRQNKKAKVVMDSTLNRAL